ncbi:prenyltransferase/squalene oxidase repeat-containing protein [Verrucomicrobium spinosum]|uniref:prenyltransferase/squalene oxidase repeat-containing protein n=1 Tax=Verrucomicrobium spinosum TaxID=2736 RepID=UPI00017463D6|nr:prenyltransferase/squalene oxidase repeat-containing protein [Verrucomicrobium spinosum]
MNPSDSEHQPSSNPVPVLPPTTGSASVPLVQIQSLDPTAPTGSQPVQIPQYEQAVPAHQHDVPQQIEHFEAPHFHAPIAPPVKKNIFAQYWRKAGGGSFMISLLIHAGLLVGAYFLVETIVTENKVDFLPGGGSKQGAEANQQLAQTVQNKKRSSLNKSTPMKKVVSTSANAAIALNDVPMESIDMPEVGSLMGGSMGSGGFGSGGAGGGFGKGIGMGGQSGFVSLPPTLKSRCSTAERLQKLKESGGVAECEKAVSTALEYLKSKQKADGSWGTQYKGAMTGFALLAYLGRCETPDSPFYGENVMKGIMFLVETQKKNPNKLFSQATSGNAPVYEHGIATYALGEMYTLARMGSKSLPGMREAFETGVGVIIDNQQKSGSWVYDTDKGTYLQGREDLSVTGWQYQALKAAKLTNLKINGLHGAIDNTVKYLENKQTKDGGIGGTNRETSYNQWELTGAGALGLQTLANGRKTEIKKAISFAHELFKKEPPSWDHANLYSWYYYQQAFFQYGGEEWNYWNAAVLKEILKNQQPDGSWKSPTNFHNASAGGDNIYPTSLCILMLEVYYRYLKVADRESSSIFDRK